MGIDAEMFVRVNRAVTADEVKKKAVAMQVAFGPGPLFVARPGRSYGQPHHSLAIVDVWRQDGPDIDPEPGETFIKVYLWTRYYGPGYERGDLPAILAVARYLRTVFEPCEIWYGGDSSGVCAEHLDDALEAELWTLFCSEHARDYFSKGFMRSTSLVRCDFCDLDANQGMFSRDTNGYVCPSCDQHWLRYADGRVVECDENYQPPKVGAA